MICLLPHCAYLSETSRMLEIYRALRALGVPARIATHGGPHEALLRAADVDYDLLEPRMSPERCARFVASGAGIGHPGQSFYDDDEMRQHVLAEAAYFRDRHVACVVIGFTLTALLSTRLAGIPLATSQAGAWVPPVWEHGLLPIPCEPPDRLRRLPRFVQRWMHNFAPPRLQIYCSGFNRLAAQLGVEGVPSFAALLMGDLTLVTDVPEVIGLPRATIDNWRPKRPRQYRRDPVLRVTGPLYAKLEAPIPARVTEFLGAPGPTIYVAITSSSEGLVRGVIGALLRLPAKILVASTVHCLRELESAQLMVEPILPNHLVMPRVDLAVTAAGQGSVQCALASGTPLIAIPLQPEQDFNAIQAERQGAARRISRKQAVTAELTELAMQMLGDSQVRANAARVRELYSRVDGAHACAVAILDYLARRAEMSRAEARPTVTQESG